MKFDDNKTINLCKSRFGAVDNAKPQLCPVHGMHRHVHALLS